MIKTETWRAVILPFTSEMEYENPFLDVVIEAEFTGPNGEKIVREAYWDCGKDYKVSFAPTAEGIWKYVIKAPAETGLNGTSGEIECVPYKGDLDIYKHGFLKVSKDRTYLTYADGTPFFWLGDTHWEFAYRERWDWSNHPDMDSMFKGMADKRAAQHYTVYQTNLRSDPMNRQGGESPYWESGQFGKLPKVSFYKEEIDRRMNYLADLGLVNALGFSWFMSVIDHVEDWKNMARYFIARYGALPIVWTTAGEVAGYFPEKRQEFIDLWREVALYIEEHDSYGNLQTAHYDNVRPFSDYYYDEEWFDFTLNQAGHGDFPVKARDFQEYREKHPDKPFVEGEALYEFCSTLEEHGTRLCTADMVRRVAYTAVQLGACGYTYGAQGIWDCVYEKPETVTDLAGFNRFGITWYEAIDGEGGKQMGYMKDFYMENHFEEMKPVCADSVSFFGVKSGKEVDMHSPLATGNKDMNRFIVYYNENTRGGCRINGVKGSKVLAKWYDPRENTYIPADAALFKLETGTLDLPGRSKQKDWLLVVEVN